MKRVLSLVHDSRFGYSALLLVVVFLCGWAVSSSADRICEARGSSHLFFSNEEEASGEYMLVAPYVGGFEASVGGSVLLIDARGVVVHEWKTKAPVLIAHLEESGNLLISFADQDADVQNSPGPGSTGVMQELSWDSDVLWEYRDSAMAFDFEPLPDGTIAYLHWEKAPSWFAAAAHGGFGPRKDTWTTGITIINRDKEKVREWRMYDHLSPRDYELHPFVPAQDWAHTNSIRYVAENPVTGTPAFLLSIRHTNTLVLVDVESGNVIWRSPEGMFSLQHDATMLDNGNVLAFDNGLARKDVPLLSSRVVEVDPRTDEIVWSYDGGPAISEKARFASSIMGSAQRLENGNTLIGVSTASRFLEVTPEGTIAWEYVNDFRNEGRAGLVFHARMYQAEGTAWASRVAVPSILSSLFCKR